MANRKGVIFAEERKRQIVDLVNANKKIVIPDLCSRFGVSPSTIRNDLRDLTETNLIVRTHGGAIINSKSGFEPLPLDKETLMLDEKIAIARRAAEYVEDGDIIAVGTGTTTFEFLKQISGRKGITAIVNDIHFAMFLERFKEFNVVVPGGTLRKDFHYLQMPDDYDYFGRINIDKAFISCNGIDPRRGITTPDPHLARDIRRMVAASSELYVLFDSSKIGAVTFSRIADLDETHTLITDDNVKEEEIKLFADAGMNLVVAEMGTGGGE